MTFRVSHGPRDLTVRVTENEDVELEISELGDPLVRVVLSQEEWADVVDHVSGVWIGAEKEDE